MKKLISTIIGITSLVMVTNAQNTNDNVFQKFGQAIGAIGSSTNWGWAGYITRSSFTDKKGSHAIGGGILGIYELNDFMGLGGGIDDIGGLSTKGQVTIMSFNVQAQFPMHPLSSFWTNSFAQKFTLTPYIYSGLGTPFGSSINQSAVIHEAEGVNLDLYSFGNDWEIGIGYAMAQRQNAGDYSGNYKDITISLHHSFK